MTDLFTDQLRAEAGAIETELERLDHRRRLIEQLLSLESGGSAPSAASPRAGRATRRSAPPVKRARTPRGLISGKIREFLGRQSEPAHATRILAYLEEHQAAPRSAKPMATLQSALQRLKEQGEVENTGRNHWRLLPAETAASAASAPSPSPTASQSATPAPAVPRPPAGSPVVTSTTTFGTRPGDGA